ncbi:hypothetical protein BGZ99_003336 [Dissophora globulifera]|uniref:Secreted protein n=1 Tax=Dissophora globulifera TaxID=979702 RepID=A0A9P6RLN0_9FUNG|nr:hypothetical protein BGZ99_003336 [Dissophora globulifera]
MVFKTTFAFLVVAALAMLCTLTPQAEAHSWVDCVDWKPASGKNKWTKGKCLGYARRYPFKKAFAKLDSDYPSRHYQQDSKNLKKGHETAPACSDRRAGEEPGADETRPSKVGDAYYKSSGSNKNWGRMTVTSVGDTLCVRWPAKNHAKESSPPPVVINWMKDDGKKNHPQSVLNKHFLTKLNYKNCDSGKSEDVRACGGCFKVPSGSPGMYLMQWRWMLNKGEYYTSCADVQVVKK